MKIVHYNYSGYPIITTYFHNNLSNIDVVLLCQHGHDKNSFIKHFSQLLAPLQRYSYDIISLYLELEHDFGSKDLVMKIADTLSTKINVMSIFVNCDRAIMDANRLEDFCITPFLKNLYSESTVNELRSMNIYVRETIWSLLNKYLKTDGYILDIHSMWPFDVETPLDTELDVEIINMSYLSLGCRGGRRKINFISNDIDGNLISSQRLADSLEKELKSKDYSVEYDKPYYMLPIRSNYYYLLKYEGIAIDVPRDLIGKSRDNSLIDFSYMEKDMKLISKLSHSISEGVMNSKIFDVTKHKNKE